jgi:uncharacterized membrane protein YfcA
MNPILATLPVTHLVHGVMPLVILASALGGALFGMVRLRKRSPDWADIISVCLAPVMFVAFGFGGLGSHWPDDTISGYFAIGFCYLAARLAWSSQSFFIRRAARTESILFGTLLLLLLSLSFWLRLDWWWEHS